MKILRQAKSAPLFSRSPTVDYVHQLFTDSSQVCSPTACTGTSLPARYTLRTYDVSDRERRTYLRGHLLLRHHLGDQAPLPVRYVIHLQRVSTGREGWEHSHVSAVPARRQGRGWSRGCTGCDADTLRTQRSHCPAAHAPVRSAVYPGLHCDQG